jgi:hypothetical protein
MYCSPQSWRRAEPRSAYASGMQADPRSLLPQVQEIRLLYCLYFMQLTCMVNNFCAGQHDSSHLQKA